MAENQTWDDTYDVVVVGAGTGLLGAITAARRGMRTLVVETGAYLGGATSMSGGGMWLPNNRILREAGAVDTKERVMTYLDNLVGATAPRERGEASGATAPALADTSL